jgi:Flp pilus assembly protein CpaB
VRRRARAIVLFAAAAACAVLAAAIADGYRSRASNQFGELGPVVVAAKELAAGRVLSPRAAERALETRRVPARFIPPGALESPEAAIGRVPASTVPAGAYLLDAQLQVPPPPGSATPKAGEGKSPVQIAVTGAEALAAGGAVEGSRVDVVVTEEPKTGSHGDTYVAASGVKLLALESGGATAEGAEAPGPAPGWTATLAVTRSQALDLISAENFARQVRLLPHS